jgi:hypothetical protein
VSREKEYEKDRNREIFGISSHLMKAKQLKGNVPNCNGELKTDLEI